VNVRVSILDKMNISHKYLLLELLRRLLYSAIEHKIGCIQIMNNKVIM